MEGYDYQFVDPGPTNDQRCPICFLVIRDAHQVTCCGKLFCKACLEKVEERNLSCPHCRQDFKGKYFPDVRSDREIKSLMVLCVYESAGCEWKGELRELDKHMKECLRKEVECPHCGERKLKALLEKHVLYDCLLREYKCPSCNVKGNYLSITTDHQEVCPEVYVICLNQHCTKRMKCKDFEEHTLICSKRKVQCPFSQFGCEFYDCQDQLSDHIEAEVRLHMELLARWVKSHAQSQIPVIPLRTAPLVLKLTEFAKLKDHNKEWFSDGFYTGPGGYQIRINVYPNGYGTSKSHYVSVFINLMPGEYDDTVEFPMKGTVRITLLNQLSNDNHHSASFSFSESEQFCKRKLAKDIGGFGRQNFIEHLLLQQENISYIQNDTLYFRVNVYVESCTKPWLI